jgi:hypothetical protein
MKAEHQVGLGPELASERPCVVQSSRFLGRWSFINRDAQSANVSSTTIYRLGTLCHVHVSCFAGTPSLSKTADGSDESKEIVSGTFQLLYWTSKAFVVP